MADFDWGAFAPGGKKKGGKAKSSTSFGFGANVKKAKKKGGKGKKSKGGKTPRSWYKKGGG